MKYMTMTDGDISYLMRDNMGLTRALYKCYKRNMELVSQVEYLSATIKKVEDQLELITVDALNK
jgi:hypothetical protein